MSDQHRHPHAAHPSRSILEKSIENPISERPASLLHVDTQQVHALLEQLDDVIFSAIQGDEEAINKAQQLWPQVVVEIGWEMVEESREQYLRYAIDVARSMETSNVRSPEQAMAALEIISLLTRN